jgi:hypothetical protein
MNLESGEREILGNGAFPVYSPSGHLLFQTNRYQSGLWAQPFSLMTLRAMGEPFPVAQGVGEPSLSSNGTLVCVRFDSASEQQLGWRGRDGMRLELVGLPQRFIRNPSLSPDGRRVVVEAVDNDLNSDIWVHELDRPMKTRITFDPASDAVPGWSPSGERIFFYSHRKGKPADLFERLADGTGEDEILAGTEYEDYEGSWSSDGNQLPPAERAV